MKPAAIAFLAAIAVSGAAEAASLRLEAISRASVFSNYEIDFFDADGDMLFSFDELTGFSGFTFFTPSGPVFYDEVVNFSVIAGISDATGEAINFRGGANVIAPIPGVFDFRVFDPEAQPPVGAVPLPAGIWLMLGALGALGFASRRRSPAAA